MPAAASPAPDPAPATRSYVIAPGRTIDGKAPGETVELEPADAVRLLDFGFILDANGDRIVRTEGPAVNVEDGVQIAPA